MSIEGLQETIGLRALPAPDNASRHYWQSAAEGRLVVQRCTTCGVFQFYPRALCTTCAGESNFRATASTISCGYCRFPERLQRTTLSGATPAHPVNVSRPCIFRWVEAR